MKKIRVAIFTAPAERHTVLRRFRRYGLKFAVVKIGDSLAVVEASTGFAVTRILLHTRAASGVNMLRLKIRFAETVYTTGRRGFVDTIRRTRLANGKLSR